jgi:hypothetical protein
MWQLVHSAMKPEQASCILREGIKSRNMTGVEGNYDCNPDYTYLQVVPHVSLSSWGNYKFLLDMNWVKTHSSQFLARTTWDLSYLIDEGYLNARQQLKRFLHEYKIREFGAMDVTLPIVEGQILTREPIPLEGLASLVIMDWLSDDRIKELTADIPTHIKLEIVGGLPRIVRKAAKSTA